MQFRKRTFASTFMMTMIAGLISTPLVSQAESSSLPQPSTTTKIDGSVSELGMSKTIAVKQVAATSTKLGTTATPKPAVVELKSAFVSKSQALKFASKEHYTFKIADSLSKGKSIDPKKLADTNYFYLNRKTHHIGVAINSAAAKTLSVGNSHIYSIMAGDTLKSTIERWALETGYQMEWLSEYDYPIKHSYEFIGKLSDKLGPINKLLSSIAGSSYALKAVITKNNVILIKDNDFSPSILAR